MSGTRHERPGVYSSYDASGITSAGRAAKRIGVAALAVKGTANAVVTADRLRRRRGGFRRGSGRRSGDEHPSEAAVCQRRVRPYMPCGWVMTGIMAAYQAAFAALNNCDAQIIVCDSSTLNIQKALQNRRGNGFLRQRGADRRHRR